MDYLPFVVAVIAAVPGVASLFLQRRKDDADVAGKYQVMAHNSAERLEALERKLGETQAMIETLRARVNELETENLQLRRRLRAKNGGEW